MFQFKQLERRSLKRKSGLQRNSTPWPPRYRCDALPTERCLKVLHHCRLTDDHRKVFSVEERGHNVFVTGQGGTGKYFLVEEIFRTLTRKGIRCVIVSASEISSTVYNDLGVSVATIHVFYGLQAADLPWNLVIQRAKSHSLVWKVRGCTVYNLGRGINV